MIMNISVPVIGDKFILKNSITTNIVFDGQNKIFVKNLIKDEPANLGDKIEITLLEGTTLKVQRVYIRQGAGADFNSVTFRISKDNPSGLPDGRFFLPIDVVNTLEVEKVTESTNEKIKTFREFHSCLHKQAEVNQRIDGSYSDPAFNEINNLPVALSGNIVFNLREECDRVKNAVDDILKKNGLDSVDALFGEAEKIINENSFSKFEERFHVAEMSINRIKNHILTEAYPVYRFKLKYRNDEPLLVLSKMGRPFFEALDEYIKITHTLINALTDEYIHLVPSFYSLIDGNYEKESFGCYSSKHNYTPKSAIKNKSGTVGVIPHDGFVDNLFTRTKSDNHGYVFHYELDNGNKLSITEMRKEIRSLAKRFTS
jgi:hypothetical protein